ncbi:DHA2 family efflux MFS transporter permease subunit [Pseudonocardia spinosispora]|uniref:DHA2 family efflux MFS transporter permease subunit n=1 Tax=Pseudonocardia spinosispora TaxID=103441 RepID=UPI0004033A01|nr:DHA2 family efflux MFS transporter permease subunit [Pseudonocardia spinosispora]
MTTSAAPDTAEGTGPIPRHVWRIAAIIAFGAFTGQLDTSVVNVGLDTVARDLGAGLDAVQWLANGYLLALAVSLPASGWLTRGLGPSRLWLLALAGFTVASALCALAGSLGWLIALRVLQGLFAGLVVPAGLTVIGRSVGPGRLGRVMATLGVVMTLAPALGPAAGGLLLRFAPWPWLFWINVPIGALGIALGLRYLPGGGADVDGGRLDWPGLTLISAAVPLVVYGFARWGEGGGPWAVGVPLAIGLLALAGFAVRSVRHARPVLDLRLFVVPRFAAAGVTSAFASAAMFGAGLLFPLYFQVGRGEDTLNTGLLLISMSVGNVVALPLVGRWVDRFGGGRVCVAGGIGSVVTTLPFALMDLHAGDVLVQALLVLRGVAIAAAMMPPTVSAFRAVTAEQLPDATTLVNILSRIGGALGGALFAVVLTGTLPLGAAAAFHTVFWWLTGASVLGVAGALWLTAAEQTRE